MSEVKVSNDIVISYDDRGQGDATVVLLHGWGCDRTSLAPQATSLVGEGFRVVAPDLRGHGLSSAPAGAYSMRSLADDIEFLCNHLNVSKVFLAGHSMGGYVGLSLAANTELSLGLVLIDSVVFPAESTLEMIKALLSLIRGADYQEVYRQAMASLMIPSDDPRLCGEILRNTPSAPQHVLASCLEGHFAQDEFAAAIASIKTPMAYIGATHPLGDPAAFLRAAPHAMTAQTLAAGHFAPLTAPQQISSMLSTFIRSTGRTNLS
jgi:pimeloyl-ACP methyl ester carboxylesterase